MVSTRPDFPSPLIRYLRVQVEMDSEIRFLLQNAADEANKAILALQGSNIGDTIRRQQIRNAQSAINRELSKLWANTGDTIRANQARAAAAAVQSNADPFIPLLREAGYSDARIDAMLRSQKATAARGVQNAVTRLTLSKIPLSERVYDSRVLASGHLDKIITSAIARGVGRDELAAAVKDFIRPDTPGGVQYAANRLARTELNNAFHGTQVQEAVKSPFVEAMRWELSGSHPRPDECNEYANGGDLRDGLWTPDNVPAKPHPNCLCYLTAETPSREEFLRKFKTGEYDEYLGSDGGIPSPDPASPVPAPRFPAKAADPRTAYRQLERARPGGLFNNVQSSALEYYKGYGYSPINNALRGVAPGVDSTGKTVAASKIQSTIRGIDSDFKKNAVALSEDTTVMRGLRPGSSVNDYVEGEFIVEAGYSSTSLAQSTAENFSRPWGDWSKGQGDGWVIDILVPKGTRTLIPGNAGGEENEVLLNRNTKFKVHKVDAKLRRIWLEVIK